jgi:hypothetical protein
MSWLRLIIGAARDQEPSFLVACRNRPEFPRFARRAQRRLAGM